MDVLLMFFMFICIMLSLVYIKKALVELCRFILINSGCKALSHVMSSSFSSNFLRMQLSLVIFSPRYWRFKVRRYLWI